MPKKDRPRQKSKTHEKAHDYGKKKSEQDTYDKNPENQEGSRVNKKKQVTGEKPRKTQPRQN